MKETTWSKLRELWAIRRHCKEIQREQCSIWSSRPVRSNTVRHKLPVFACLSSCFLVACTLHVRDVWLHGWLPYHNAPLPLNCFWTALVVLDLSAAILLITRPRVGLIMSMVIMVVDVAVNAWARFNLHLMHHTRGVVVLILQLSFLAVVSAVTASTIGRRKPVRVN